VLGPFAGLHHGSRIGLSCFCSQRLPEGQVVVRAEERVGRLQKEVVHPAAQAAAHPAAQYRPLFDYCYSCLVLFCSGKPIHLFKLRILPLDYHPSPMIPIFMPFNISYPS
jgi:hypothetical protein